MTALAGRFAAKHLALPLAILAIATSPTTYAYPAKETEILSTTSYAVATAGQKNRRGGEAYCRQAKKTLTTKPEEAYMYAEVERCFAMVADTAGDKPAACKHFKKALDIWAKTPPPNDHPQSVASRAAMKTSMQQYRLLNCAGKPKPT